MGGSHQWRRDQVQRLALIFSSGRRISENRCVAAISRRIAERPMPTECIPDLFGFAPVEGREVVAAFDAVAVTSDAGALLLSATDRAIRMMDRFASWFH